MRRSIVFFLASYVALAAAHPVREGAYSSTERGKIENRSRLKQKSRQFTTSDLYRNWPTFEELPLDSSFPPKSAWGVWGSEDEHGALNHITNATIVAAKEEILLGRAFSLNLDLDHFPTPLNTVRKPTVHEFRSEPGYMDDIVNINTQAGTQYDGLRHMPYSTNGNTSTYQYYNDLLTYEDITGPIKKGALGIQQAARKGIAARGVLLDFPRWAAAHNVSFDPFTKYPITASQLSSIAAYQGLTEDSWQSGDILLVRTVWLARFNALTVYQKASLPWSPPTQDANQGLIGVDASPEVAEWLWNKKLSLVGADNPAFEVVPLAGTPGGGVGVHGLIGKGAISLHMTFLAGWGQSIMEYLDLEELAEALHTVGRSTFFLTVQNLVIEGGIASPPNTMAII